MIVLKSPEEIELMRGSGRLTAMALDEVASHIEPGITTEELDRLAEKFIVKNGGRPAFKGYRGYKHSLCISINEEVVHGIPGSRRLKEGDIVSVDCGVLLNGYYGDSAWTYAVGEVSSEADKLMKVAEESLWAGIRMAQADKRLYDVSAAIQNVAEGSGFSVVREMVGHGIGRELHEDPQVPNYGEAGTGPRLRAGLVMALEPMVNLGGWQVETLDDGWTVVTSDRSLSAHYEHTVAVTDGKPLVLTGLS